MIMIVYQGHGLGAPRGLPDDADGWCGANMFRAEGDIGPDFNGLVNRPLDLAQYQHARKPISRYMQWYCTALIGLLVVQYIYSSTH